MYRSSHFGGEPPAGVSASCPFWRPGVRRSDVANVASATLDDDLRSGGFQICSEDNGFTVAASVLGRGGSGACVAQYFGAGQRVGGERGGHG